MRTPRVLTWHVHGSYLWYLSHADAEFFLPVKPGRPEGYGGRTPSFPWPANVHEVDASTVADLELDCILFQSRRNLEVDQFEILSAAQRTLPRVYLEHDPPRESPTDTRHPVADQDTLVVHVTGFNALMWDNGRSPVRVVEHGVVDPGHLYRGTLDRGIAIVNNLGRRGRRLGADVFVEVRDEVPIDLAGMGSGDFAGLGDLPHAELMETAANYRFFFNPIRYTSLGLAICEAMMVGLPVVGLATTELVTVIEDGWNGYLDTRPERLIDPMRALLKDPELARTLGNAARKTAIERFGIERFSRDWECVFRDVTGGTRTIFAAAAAAGGAA